VRPRGADDALAFGTPWRDANGPLIRS